MLYGTHAQYVTNLEEEKNSIQTTFNDKANFCKVAFLWFSNFLKLNTQWNVLRLLLWKIQCRHNVFLINELRELNQNNDFQVLEKYLLENIFSEIKTAILLAQYLLWNGQFMVLISSVYSPNLQNTRHPKSYKNLESCTALGKFRKNFTAER